MNLKDVTIKTSDGALLTLQTSDTTITDGDVLGALQFQAPDDTDGKTGDIDGSKVTASIVVKQMQLLMQILILLT